MFLRLHILLTSILFCTAVFGQVQDTTITSDSITVSLRSRLPLPDSLSTAQSDSLPGAPAGVRISDDALDDEVEYNSQDSMRFDYARSEVHLYGDAFVQYQNFTLKADYIVFNLDSSIAYAQGFPDSAGVPHGFPEFTSDNQSFGAKRLRYNFASQKGKIYEALTEQSDLYIHGAQTKFIGAAGDTTGEIHVYSKGALITTCDAEEPHFGIRASKIKMIPDRLAVIGPSNLEIQGVPTPLWLPFGFFPVTSSRRSGLIFPTDYEYSDAWGFGLRDIGYYIPISEYIDVKVLGDIYFNGSYGVGVSSSYRKRYKYSGSINLGYSARKNEVIGELDPAVQRSYSIRISHNQDPKAHPYRRLGGSINIQTNDYQSLNQNDANSVLTSVYSSNFSWSRTFPEKPYSLSIGLNHSQNTRTKQITIDAPNIDFRVNRIYPFKSKNRIGKEKWYEKIGFTYSGGAKSKFLTTDSTLFTQSMWEQAQYGVQHKLSTDLSFTALKYFHITPSASYEDTWFFKEQVKTFFFDPDTDIRYDTVFDNGIPIIVADTISRGTVDTDTLAHFNSFKRFSTGISLTTQIFGLTTKEFKKGWFRGFRHVIKPAISFNYSPDIYDRFRDSVQTDVRRPDQLQGYSILQGGVYSAGLVNGDQAAIGYSFNNIFEAKYWSKRDNTTKKLKLFDNIIVNGNYNIAADSLKFSMMNINGTTRFFKGATTLSFSAMYDFYKLDPETLRRVDDFYWNSPGKLLRFDNFQMRISTRLTIRKIKDLFNGTDESNGSGGSSDQGQRRPQQGNDQFFNLFDDFSLDHNFGFILDGRLDTTRITTHTVNMRGSVKLTKKWSITVGNIGYDLRAKQLTYPDFGFTRDLHCWIMSMSWQPQRGTYTLRIGVKPGSLDFIKIPHNRNLPDSFGGF